VNGFSGIPEWILVLVGFSLFVITLFALRRYQASTDVDPERVRKLFHLSGGVFGLALPWLFDELASVLMLSATAALLFAAMRIIPVLRNGIGRVLGDVERRSVGEFCFLASLCLLFWMADGDPLLYSVPILVLAVADAMAALVGKGYGRSLVIGWRSVKSLEGSIAFLVVTFFCVHIPLLLFTETPRLETLLIAVNIALMVMLAEMLTWWGLDNIIIPMFTFALLVAFLPMDALSLAGHLGILLGVGLFIRIWRPHTSLADDALFGAALSGYLVWALADWRWFLAPFILILLYAVISAASPFDRRHPFHFPVLLATVVAGMFWLLAYLASGDELYFYPFTTAFAVNLTLIVLVRQRYAAPEGRLIHALYVSCAKGLIVLLPGFIAFDGVSFAAVGHTLTGLVALIIAVLLFCRVQPGLERMPVDTPRWIRQALVSAVASAVALIPVVQA
jgi:phytol kinase